MKKFRAKKKNGSQLRARLFYAMTQTTSHKLASKQAQAKRVVEQMTEVA